MDTAVAIAIVSYLPPTLIALTGLIVAMANGFHLQRVDHALLAVETVAASAIVPAPKEGSHAEPTAG